jgi:hypothetical protein
VEESRWCWPSTSCRARRATIRWPTCRTARSDWLDHQLAARELLQLDVANTHLVVEHEYPKARIQDRDRVTPILQGSIAFVRQIDEAAASMFALQHEVLAAQDIPTQASARTLPIVTRC